MLTFLDAMQNATPLMVFILRKPVFLCLKTSNLPSPEHIALKITICYRPHQCLSGIIIAYPYLFEAVSFNDLFFIIKETEIIYF